MNLQAAFEPTEPRDWDTGPDGTVRIGVVGVGGFARNVALPAIEAAEYCEPAILVTGSPDAVGDVGDWYDIPAISYEAYADGESASAYDAVYLATPNALHLPHAETAAALEKHVICEKPLEASVERAERLVGACADAGVVLMTAYRIQTDPVFRRLRGFLTDGGLGRVTKLHGDFTYPVLGGTRGPDQWRLDPELGGGGALPDIGVYPLNTARFLLGANPVSVRGVTAGDGVFEGTDETVAFLVEFPDAVTGLFTASFTGPADTRLDVYGEAGRVSVTDAFQPRTERTVRVATDGAEATFTGFGADEVREEFDYFAHCVLTDRRPEPDGEDGLADLRAMAAVYRDAGLDVPMAE